MERWASLELAPWRGLAFGHGVLLDGLEEAARRDPSIHIYHIRDGAVTLVGSHVARMPPPKAAFATAQAGIFAAFLQFAVTRHRIDCDIHIGVRMEDRGPEERRVPLFCFHKLRGESNILLPDLNFWSCGFYAGADFTDDRAFADKRAEAGFVGATTNGIVTMARVLAGGHPRIRAARFFREEPGVTFEISRVVQCDSEETRAAVERLVPMASGPRGWADQFACRYLIGMDGNGAAWSRTAVALASSSVPVVYASAYQLYYARGLEPWVHYIPVRRDEDVLEVVAQAERTAARDAAIAKAGQAFAREHLTEAAVTAYLATLLRGYAAIVGGG